MAQTRTAIEESSILVLRKGNRERALSADFFGSRMALILPDGIQEVELQVPGEHNVRNAAGCGRGSRSHGYWRSER